MYNSYLKEILNDQDFKNLVQSNFCKSSFAQFGEDLLVNKILSKITFGNFLDLGSFHPVHFSNTFLLYLRGWRGVNIDGNKELIEISKKVRPLDKNIFRFLSDKEGESFYIKNKKLPALNRVSRDIKNLGNNENYIKIHTSLLNETIREEGEFLKKLFYLNIDLEFNDEAILRGFDFKNFHPLLITIESHKFNFYSENRICKFLKKYNYSLYSFINPTAFYIDNDFKKNDFHLG
tara:strand:+ start:45 stop:746 length:702 start_codon:yes stop_codon:yes gene_type:complete